MDKICSTLQRYSEGAPNLGTGKRKKVKIADYLNEDVNHGHIKLKGVGIPLAQI